MKPTVEQWLADGRRREPSIEESVRTWNFQAPRPRGRPRKKVLPDGMLGIEVQRLRKKKPSHVSAYLPDEMLIEVQRDAARHGRSVSQTLVAAWMIAREEITKYPGAAK